MKDLKLKLIVEVIRKDDDVTYDDLLENVRKIVIGNGIGGSKLMIKIKDVQPMKNKKHINPSHIK